MNIELFLSGDEEEEWYHMVIDSESYLEYSDPYVY